MSQALYRKYRSLTLDDVLGQDHIVALLKRALEKDKIAHAYLLSGPRGTGKTSVARILAHEINKLPYSDETSHIDIIEIDAASNNGVDDIRNLREKSRIAPVSAKYKVYIIDEVHMLSKSAFNALLKTLEEPPEHIVFIMATTDADKLPATILSRVQQFHFHSITSDVIAKRLVEIAKKEGFRLEKSAADIIADRGNGGFRDSISMLDQLSSLIDQDKCLTADTVTSSLGLADSQQIDALIDAYLEKDASKLISILSDLNQSGSSTQTIVEQLLKSSRSKLIKQPELVNLMNRLVDVPNHTYPDIKILTALTVTIAPTPVTPSLSPKPPKVSTVAAAVSAPVKAVVESAPEVNEPVASYKPAPKKSPAMTIPVKDFDWSKLIEAVKMESIGLYSFMAKCSHDITNEKLTIYSGTQFTKKQLEDAKNMQIIASKVSDLHGDTIDIDIISGNKPLVDDKLATVAKMMGGGEEISLEETL